MNAIGAGTRVSPDPPQACPFPDSAGPVGWTVAQLLRELAARRDHAAIIAFGDGGVETWDGKTLADQVWRLAAGLRAAGVKPGTAVALCAPNSPRWIALALATMAVGAMLVPIDDLATPEQLVDALKSSNAAVVVTTWQHYEAGRALAGPPATSVVLVDGAAAATSGARSWAWLLGEPVGELPPVPGEAAALLTWTSGTTGSPKAFILTHRNIATNVDALARLTVVGPRDRALLPLPLHHVYPFVVGMLTPLTCATAVVLPSGPGGPALLHALREGGVTALVGVPRLYEALTAAILQRLGGRYQGLRRIWLALLTGAAALRKTTRLNLGKLLFLTVRRGVAPSLRVLVSGGAALESGTERQLEGLGWTLLSGYGLAETASLFTGNRPGVRRSGSVGRPLADGEIRIAEPDEAGVGEIELRGRSITAGYLDNPAANQAAFTGDGWFRTGDLGFVDAEGFLFVTGRIKEALVLGGGKKVNPEELERGYGAAPEIAEIAVLEHNGALVALVRPDRARLYARGATNLRDAIRVILSERAQRLPSYQRLAGFALTADPLPRTRLGKFQRFLLPALYVNARTGALARAPEPPSPADRALLQDPIASAVWRELGTRFAGQALDLDANLGLDLNLDSFGWMELAILLDQKLGIRLSDQDLSRIETVRDLLRLAVARGVATAPAREPNSDRLRGEDDWLSPTAPALTAVGAALWLANYLIMRGLFRLRVAGAERLPAAGAFVIAPNHVSYLDVLAVAAALRWSRLRRTYWAGDAKRFFPHRLGRVFCRAVHLFPVDAMHPGEALDTGRRALEGGSVLVWFPEGWRSPDGRLQRFQPGVGQLLLSAAALAVPTLIEGTFEALPRGRVIPRLRRLRVTFGSAVGVAELQTAGSGAGAAERVADGLRQSVAALAVRSDA